MKAGKANYVMRGITVQRMVGEVARHLGFPQNGRRRTILSYVSIGTIAALLLAACGTSSSSSTGSTAATAVTHKSSSGSPVIFNAILSETGPGAFLGSHEAKVLKILEKQVNSAGGIDGHPLQMKIIDNQSSPSTAVSEATSLISKGVPFFLNGSIGNVDEAVDALSTPSGPFIYDLAPDVHPAPGSKVFSAFFSLTSEVESYLAFLKSKHLTNLATLTAVQSDQSFTLLKNLLSQPKYSSFHLVSAQTFDAGAVSVTAQLSVIKAQNPQALIVLTTGTPLGTVLNGMSSLGMDNLPTIADSGNGSFAEMAHFSSVLPKNFYLPITSMSIPASQLPSGVAQRKADASFQSLIKNAGGKPGSAWGIAWDPANLIIDALKHLGAHATSNQILNYMENLHNVPGVMGVYNTSVSNHRGLSINDIYIASWDGTKFVLASGPGGAPLSKSGAQ